VALSLPKVGKKKKLAQLAWHCGFVHMMEQLPRRRCLIVLNYHRVVDSYLKAHFHIAKLEEVQDFVERPERISQAHILITFDDGYLDNYEIAFPILKSHGVQGTFFLPTSFIETDRIPWWDQVAFLLHHTKRCKISLTYPQSLGYDLSEMEIEGVIRAVLASYKSQQVDSARFLASLEQACDIAMPQTAEKRSFMNWTEAAEMARTGMAFGSHTHNHEILSKLSAEAQYEELRRSREILSQRLSLPIETLAYPVGARSSFSADTQQALSQAGYKAAFSFYGGVNLPQHLQRFDLLRLAVEREMNLPLFRFQVLVAATTGKQFY
jgi:peptidoglycan/xylan/chitin deacetylase (PgdA/CDA1 family)